MTIDTYADKEIAKKIEDANAEKSAAHKSSGKLSASALGQPLQWQILKSMGVPQRQVDNYTLRKFLRGNHVEEWLLSIFPDILKKDSLFCEYRGAIGYADAFADTKNWQFPNGEIPLEIKSVSGMKFKKILKQGPDRSHKLQNGLYALAKGLPSFAIAYVNTDDYRLHVVMFRTEEVKADIDRIIDRYEAQKASGLVPVFEAEETWQASETYCNYPEFINLTSEEATAKALEIVNQLDHAK